MTPLDITFALWQEIAGIVGMAAFIAGVVWVVTDDDDEEVDEPTTDEPTQPELPPAGDPPGGSD